MTGESPEDRTEEIGSGILPTQITMIIYGCKCYDLFLRDVLHWPLFRTSQFALDPRV